MYDNTIMGNEIESVQIVDIVTQDSNGNQKWFFERSQSICLDIIIYSKFSNNITANLVVTIFDSELFPINISKNQILLSPGINIENVSLKIPSYAFIGISEVFVNLLKDLHEGGGSPYCPESSVRFMITDSIIDIQAISEKACIGIQSDGYNFIHFHVDNVDTTKNDIHFPYGIFSFELNVEKGSKSNITLHFFNPDGDPAQLNEKMDYWKYTADGKGSPHGEIGWYNIPSIIERNTMIFQLEDGGIGDSDGLINGVISDPGGVGEKIYPVGGEIEPSNHIRLFKNFEELILLHTRWFIKMISSYKSYYDLI